MKKIFSFLMALTLVMGCYAMPQHKYGVSRRADAKSEKMVKPEMKKMVKKDHFFKSESMTTAPAMRKMVMAENELQVEFADLTYYAGGWDVNCYASEDVNYYPDVYFSIEATSSTKIAGTYSITGDEYSYIYFSENDSVKIVSGSLTIAYKSTSADGLVYTFTASLQGDDTKSYTISADLLVYAKDFETFYYGYYLGYCYYFGEYCDWEIELDDAPFDPTGKVITISTLIPEVTDSTSASVAGFQAIGKTEDGNSASLCINSTSLLGSFDPADFDMDYTYIRIGEEYIALKYAISASVTMSSDTTIFYFEVMAKSGDEYHVTMKHYIPEIIDNIDVVCTNLKVKEDGYPMIGYVWYTVSASNEDYSLYMEPDSATGEFVGALLLFDKDTNEIPLVYDTITIVAKDKAYGVALDAFGHHYTFDLSLVLPDAKDSVYLTYENAEILDATMDYMAVLAMGNNAAADSAVQFYISTYVMEGEYTEDDIDMEGYSFVALPNQDTIFKFIAAEISITQKGDTAFLTAKVLGSDTVRYFINMKAINDPYEYDSDEDLTTSFDAKVDQVEWYTDGFESYGVVELYAVSSEEENEMSLMFFSETAEIADGVYDINSSMAAPSVLASAGYDKLEEFDYPSYFVLGDYSSTWYFVSGTVTVGNGQVVIAAKNSKDKDIKITVTLPATGLKERIANVKAAAKFIYKNQLMIKSNNRIFNAFGAELR